MRIRLCVKRNGLPDANLLWPAAEQVNGTKQKIADLITSVNETMPLESMNWTVEDYIVEVAGFECLHWQFLEDVLKDEDQVTIRPMEQTEVRARQVSGRFQIHPNGFHLVDGVPFGTRPLRPISRPQVVIPPRKRRRISTDDQSAEQGSLEQGAQLSIANVDNDEEQLALLNTGNATLKEGTISLGRIVSKEKARKQTRTTKRVHFASVDVSAPLNAEAFEDEYDDDDDDEDFEEGSSSLTSSDDSSTNDSDSDSASDDSVSDSASNKHSSGTAINGDHGDLSIDTDSSEDSSDSDSEAPSEESSHRTSAQPKYASASGSAPGQGQRLTQERNRRRRDAQRLRHLQSVGILPSGATMKDLRCYREEKAGDLRPLYETVEVAPIVDISSSSEGSSDESSADSDQESNEESSDESADGLDEVSSAASTSETTGVGPYMDPHRAFAMRTQMEPDSSPENEPAIDFGRAPRDKHVASYIINGKSSSEKNGTDAAESPITGPGKALSVDEVTNGDSSTRLENIARRQLVTEAAQTSGPNKRARLNVEGAKRVIFGNLGQRTPKTKADEERVKEKLMNVGKPKPATLKETKTVSTEETFPPESEAWRSKLRVMACECVDEDVILSEPPYPFQQRWDPQQQFQKDKWAKKKRKRNNRRSYGSEAFDYEGDSYVDYGDDGYEEDGYDDSVLLVYDDDVEAPAEEEEGVEKPLQNVRVDFAEKIVKDLPALPEDMTTLPVADKEDFKPSTIVAFKYLKMGPSFRPEMTGYRTAEVIEVADDGTIDMCLAIRDREEKKLPKYDNEGKRIYGRFEMPQSEDEESDEGGEDDGIISLRFADFFEPKIVKMASKAAGPEGAEDTAMGAVENADGRESNSWEDIAKSAF